MSLDIAFDYKVTNPAVVLDVGAYNGDFTDFIRQKYQCGVHAFEPSLEKFSALIKKYSSDPLVFLYNVALEDEKKTLTLFGTNDSRSIYRTAEPEKEEIRVEDIWGYIQSFKLPKIDILKINAEGSEFKILARLCETHFIPQIGNIVVQWHALGEHPETLRAGLEIELARTHNLQFNSHTNWQWWERK